MLHPYMDGHRSALVVKAPWMGTKEPVARWYHRRAAHRFSFVPSTASDGQQPPQNSRRRPSSRIIFCAPFLLLLLPAPGTNTYYDTKVLRADLSFELTTEKTRLFCVHNKKSIIPFGAVRGQTQTPHGVVGIFLVHFKNEFSLSNGIPSDTLSTSFSLRGIVKSTQPTKDRTWCEGMME